MPVAVLDRHQARRQAVVVGLDLVEAPLGPRVNGAHPGGGGLAAATAAKRSYEGLRVPSPRRSPPVQNGLSWKLNQVTTCTRGYRAAATTVSSTQAACCASLTK